MKVRLNPNGDNFMLFDDNAGLFLSVTHPTCIIDKNKLTEGLKRAINVGTLIIEEDEDVNVEDEDNVKSKDNITAKSSLTVKSKSKSKKEVSGKKDK